MTLEVYKDTLDDWQNSYQLEGTFHKVVRVSLFTTVVPDKGEVFRVCVWGSGEFGMDSYFEEKDEAVQVFRTITGLQTVNFSDLRKLGFTVAE